MPKTPARQSTDLVAIRPAAGAEAAIRKALPADARVDALADHDLLLVRMPASATRSRLHASLARLREQGKVQFANPVLQDRESGLLQIPTDEIIVRCKPSTSEEQCHELVAGLGLQVVRRNEFVPGQFVVRVAPGAQADAVKLAAQLARSPHVEFATPNFVSQHARTPVRSPSRK
jgi:hypothetical protein